MGDYPTNRDYYGLTHRALEEYKNLMFERDMNAPFQVLGFAAWLKEPWGN